MATSGFKELYEMLVLLDQKLDTLVSTQTDHEARLKHLEATAGRRWQIWLAVVGGCLGLLAGTVGGLIGLLR